MDPPSQPNDLAEWLAATVLDPSHALFREDEYLLREDPRITAEAPYYSLLQAIASGRTSQGRIAAAVGRAPGDIAHHLKVMTTAGFVVRDHDLPTARRPAYRIADPIVRFHHLVTRRHMAMLEDRRAPEVWARSEATYRSNVVGPHFETICRLWVNRYASTETLGRPTGPARRLQINHRDRTRSFELDIAAPAIEPAAGRRRVVVQAIGEGQSDLTRPLRPCPPRPYRRPTRRAPTHIPGGDYQAPPLLDGRIHSRALGRISPPPERRTGRPRSPLRRRPNPCRRG